MEAKNPYKRGGMFEGAAPIIFENAKQLRKNMTDAEKVLWAYLRTGVNGLRFRRQHPIGHYIADFFCHKAKLVVEIDGSIHTRPDIKEKDDIRQKELENLGYFTIRFTNEQVMKDIEVVIKTITEKTVELNKLFNQNTP